MGAAIIRDMHLPPEITHLQYAGHEALRLATRHGSAIIALHGAHLLSWVPAGQRDVFWLSPDSPPEPAAIRGGVPVCWPQHGGGHPAGAVCARPGLRPHLPWRGG